MLKSQNEQNNMHLHKYCTIANGLAGNSTVVHMQTVH